MKKTYRSVCELHFSLRVGENHRKIDFTPRRDHYIYSTTDAIEQDALEKSHKFGLMYVFDREGSSNVQEAGGGEEEEVIETTVEANVEDKQDITDQKSDGGVMEFANNQDAKNYLMDVYDLKSTNMRNKEQIEEQAKSVGIVIKWV